MRSMSNDLSVGCCCVQGFYFGFVFGEGRGVLTGSVADSVFSASWVLDVDFCRSIPNYMLSRAVCVESRHESRTLG